MFSNYVKNTFQWFDTRNSIVMVTNRHIFIYLSTYGYWLRVKYWVSELIFKSLMIFSNVIIPKETKTNMPLRVI